MEGMYTSKERVVRDGFLIAFEGEEMTMDEAVARGLVSNGKKTKKQAKAELKTDSEPKPEPEPEPDPEPEPEPEQEAE